VSTEHHSVFLPQAADDVLNPLNHYARMYTHSRHADHTLSRTHTRTRTIAHDVPIQVVMIAGPPIAFWLWYRHIPKTSLYKNPLDDPDHIAL